MRVITQILSIVLFISLFTGIIASAQPFQVKNLIQYVDPFIGTGDTPRGGGCTFPGAMLPFGLVKLGPDMDLKYSTSGYMEGKDIIGFSHVHASGTGGGASYGNVLMMATTGAIDPNNYSSPGQDEFAKPGLFSVFLKKYNIQAELTATHRTGFHQYTMPASDKANIIIDAGHFLGHDDTWGEAQVLVGSEIEIISNTEIRGYNRIRGGWNYGLAYTVYFYARFETPAASFGTWKNGKVHPVNQAEFDSGVGTGAYFTYKTVDKQKIRAKVGISFISSLKAKQNLETENPGWDFDAVKTAADQTWNKVLSNALVEGKSEDDKKIFYSALYHFMLMPTDRSDENPKWLSKEPYYDDFYTIWDTYRCSNPLLTLLMSKREVDIVRSLVDTYQYEGYMPDGRMGNENGRTQGGSNCDNVVADAYVKGLTGIDYEKVYQAMIKDAEVPPGDDERKHGRGGLADYNTLGYITPKYERAGNRQVEYAHNDWSIAQVANGLGKMDDYKKYKSRASNWQNLWKKDAESLGAKGFIWPRDKDGNWQTQLFECSGTEKGAVKQIVNYHVFHVGGFPSFFYESNSWSYSLYVPQDVKKLMEFCGGKNAFVSRLDTFFVKGIYDVGNEPGFLTPYLYIWAGQPAKTAFWVNNIRNKYYNSGRSGIPGNDDAGAMSSLYAFMAMGIYPNSGMDVYLIASPIFDRTTIQMDNGKNFTITAKNVSKENIYVQSATLNGKPLNQAWFRHTDISNGGTLDLVMGNKPSLWGTSNPPPSMSDTE